MSIEQEIKGWDGKSSVDIGVIYDCYCSNASFVQTLIQLLGMEELQKGATWLLKRHLEEGYKVNASQVSKVIKLLPRLIHWESKLHALQCIPYTKIANRDKKETERFLRKCLSDKNKFVRAWSYNGFYELSLQHSEYMAEAKLFLDMAMRDEAPSIKARIRNIMKEER